MSAGPATYDEMTVYRGLTFTKVFACQNPDGSAVDLTGFTGRFRAKASGSADYAIDLTGEPGIVMGGTAGTITVTVADDATAVIADDELDYSLTVSNGTETDGLLQGVIPVEGVP